MNGPEEVLNPLNAPSAGSADPGPISLPQSAPPGSNSPTFGQAEPGPTAFGQGEPGPISYGQAEPGPISMPGSQVMLNPQPLPPGSKGAAEPGPTSMGVPSTVQVRTPSIP